MQITTRDADRHRRKPFQSLSSLTANPHPAFTAGDLVRLVLVTFLWALCYPLITAGLALAPPLTFAALRALVAGAGLLAVAAVLRRPLPQDAQTWLALLGVGLSATSLGFTGMFLAGGAVSPGLATVIANAQPLIAAVLAYFVLAERLGRRRRTGLALGFAGIVLVALPGFGSSANSTPLGVAYVLLGALGVAVGNVQLKRLAGEVDLWMATGWQFVLGSVPLFLAAQIFESSAYITWTPTFVTVLLVLSLVGTALAFVLWFSLLQRGELTRLNIFTFLTPVFALLLGAVFFGERMRLVEGAGMALILAGVWWISRKPGIRKAAGSV